MQSNYVERFEGFQLHFLEWKPKITSNKLPVICIHGNLSNARMYNWVGDELSSEKNENPRHVIAIDIRGCGESGMPEEGFSLQHMATDIEAVMIHLGISKAHLIAYSRGVAYALKYALRNPDNVQGIVIGDYPAHYTKLNEDWAKRMVNSYELYDSWDSLYTAIASTEDLSREEFEDRKEDFYVEKAGVIQKRYSKEFPVRLQLESNDYDLSSALDNVKGKMLILKGNEEGSLLSDERIKVYQKYNPEVVRVHQAGHDVFEPRKQVKEALINYFNHII
jgi:pimeloyl-ACP methyl ester carboxylesterase